MSNDCFVRVCTPSMLTLFNVCIKLYLTWIGYHDNNWAQGVGQCISFPLMWLDMIIANWPLLSCQLALICTVSKQIQPPNTAQSYLPLSMTPNPDCSYAPSPPPFFFSLLVIHTHTSDNYISTCVIPTSPVSL